MSEIEFRMESAKLSLVIPDELLLAQDDQFLRGVGELVAKSFIRRRNDLLCARDGHIPEVTVPSEFEGMRCGCCFTILDQVKYDRLMARA